MNLYARIRGVDYAVGNGANFTDTINETLDTGSISIPHVGIIDMKPYDDIFIHDYLPNVSESEGGLPPHGFGVPKGTFSGHFFKHMLCGDISRQQVYIDDDGMESRKGRYNYTVSLISETKGLENAILPNVNVFQPNSSKDGRRLGDIAEQFLEVYSPYIKAEDTENSSGGKKVWKWQRKYALSDETKKSLNKAKCPELNFSYSNLREVMNSMFRVVDSLPYVFNGKIYALNLTERGEKFDDSHESWSQWNMASSEYCDRLVRVHSQSLSRDSKATITEKIGFRNRNSDSFTLDNLQLCFSHPIYKIDKIKMCYYVLDTSENYSGEKSYSISLVKQDITPLVILNEQRSLLSVDWHSYTDKGEGETIPYIGKIWHNVPYSIYGHTNAFGEYVKGLADYKLSTIGYSIGSDTISGWGEKYTYPSEILGALQGSVKVTRTYIENILTWFSNRYPHGCDFMGHATTDNVFESKDASEKYNPNVIVPFDFIKRDVGNEVLKVNSELWLKMKILFNDYTQIIKSLVFEVTYEPYISASVVASKDFHDGCVLKRDNPEGSLPYVERDGTAEKEKANRLGNPTVVKVKRVSDYSELLPEKVLKSVYDDDCILYQYSYTLTNDYFTATYYFAKDYIIRNYFNSVFSKRRPFSMASYGDSTERIENRCVQLLFSFESQYRQNSSRQMEFSDDILGKLIDLKDTKYEVGAYVSTDQMVSVFTSVNDTEKINTSYMVNWATNDEEKSYLYEMDSLAFMSGKSLCFEMKMPDSVSMGVYINRATPDFGTYLTETIFKKVDLTLANFTADQEKAYAMIPGSLQNWLMLDSDDDTGRIDRLSFGIGRCSTPFYLDDGSLALNLSSGALGNDDSVMDVASNYVERVYDRLGKKPLLTVREIDGSISCGTTGDVETNNKITEIDASSVARPEGDTDRSAKLTSYMNTYFGDDTHADHNGAWLYKDGKEKLNVTLQVEPISDDGIFIGENLLGMSDMIGIHEKRNSDVMIVGAGENLMDLDEFKKKWVTIQYSTYIFNTRKFTRDSDGKPTGSFTSIVQPGDVVSAGFPVFTVGIFEEVINKFKEFKRISGEATKTITVNDECFEAVDIPFRSAVEENGVSRYGSPVLAYKDEYNVSGNGITCTNWYDCNVLINGIKGISSDGSKVVLDITLTIFYRNDAPGGDAKPYYTTFTWKNISVIAYNLSFSEGRKGFSVNCLSCHISPVSPDYYAYNDQALNEEFYNNMNNIEGRYPTSGFLENTGRRAYSVILNPRVIYEGIDDDNLKDWFLTYFSAYSFSNIFSVYFNPDQSKPITSLYAQYFDEYVTGATVSFTPSIGSNVISGNSIRYERITENGDNSYPGKAIFVPVPFFKKKNLYWFFWDGRLSEENVFRSFNGLDELSREMGDNFRPASRSIIKTIYDPQLLRIILTYENPDAFNAFNSAMLYYVDDDGFCKFLIGFNFRDKGGNRYDNVFLSKYSDVARVEANILLSLVDSRSLSVLDTNGDVTEKAKNYASEVEEWLYNEQNSEDNEGVIDNDGNLIE